MEIQKIFSDYEGEERLYSVLMDEEELMLFSELQKEFNSKAQKALRKAWEEAEGIKNGAQKFISKGYRTVENPDFRREAREAARGLQGHRNVHYDSLPLNHKINLKGTMEHKRNGYGVNMSTGGKISWKKDVRQFKKDHPSVIMKGDSPLKAAKNNLWSLEY